MPLHDAQRSNGGYVVPYDLETVGTAPSVTVRDGHLDADEEAQLYRHYGFAYDEEDGGDVVPGAPTG